MENVEAESGEDGVGLIDGDVGAFESVEVDWCELAEVGSAQVAARRSSLN
ncbi:hypothetical protein GCM10023196_095370 [Actinoallomurus vinaceus]|uniref:Uncharacterized protein n=1 Tax=Actinoallomurus vinaceus TaxID=1080074 RepID=A0ABP8UTS0_9ACTN